MNGLSDITAVLTVYNSADVIADALRAIPDEVRCIVVDNASRDGSGAVASASRANVDVVTLTENLGFGRGCNAGLGRVNTAFAVVVNPDLTMDSDALQACLDAAENHPNTALFGANTGGLTGDAIPVETVSGSFMFMRMDQMRKVGFFDPAIFMYFEDNDLCLRVQAADYGVAVVPNARVHHAEGGSTAAAFDNVVEKSRVWGHACAYFAQKHRDHPAGQKAGRKAARYGLKRFTKLLAGDLDGAKLYAARYRGFREFQARGRDVMFDNKFI